MAGTSVYATAGRLRAAAIILGHASGVRAGMINARLIRIRPGAFALVPAGSLVAAQVGVGAGHGSGWLAGRCRGAAVALVVAGRDRAAERCRERVCAPRSVLADVRVALGDVVGARLPRVAGVADAAEGVGVHFRVRVRVEARGAVPAGLRGALVHVPLALVALVPRHASALVVPANVVARALGASAAVLAGRRGALVEVVLAQEAGEPRHADAAEKAVDVQVRVRHSVLTDGARVLVVCRAVLRICGVPAVGAFIVRVALATATVRSA